MKKSICSLLIVVVLFNFILGNKVYADEDGTTFLDDVSIDNNPISSSDLENLINESKTNYADSVTTIDWGAMGAVFGTISGIIATIINIFPMLIGVLMNVCCNDKFTIEKAVFNQIPIFNIDYFNFSNPYKYKIGLSTKKTISTTSTIPVSLRTSVAKYFYICRLLAISVSLLILVYVGIRMALSTISSDKAKYKKMLLAWFESIILLFCMQYIISALIEVGKTCGNIVYDLKCIMDANGELSFESGALETMFSSMFGNAGWTYVQYSITYWVLIYIQTKFFFMYYKRTIIVGFLILISPIVTITYPIDKIGDGNAQAFKVWLNELVVNILIQPIQALIYLMFMYTAGEIAKTSMWVALAFLLGLTKIEKVIMQLFNLKNVTSLKPVDEERKK